MMVSTRAVKRCAFQGAVRRFAPVGFLEAAKGRLGPLPLFVGAAQGEGGEQAVFVAGRVRLQPLQAAQLVSPAGAPS